jgi:PAS domain S-box-containing protein
MAEKSPGELKNIITALEEELSELKRKVEDFYLPLTELTNESLFLVDKECRYLFITNNMADNFGRPLSEVIGKKYGDFHKKEAAEILAERVAAVFATGSVTTDEHINRRGNKHIYRKFSPVKSPQGEVIKVAVIGQDITRLKEGEKNLLTSQQQWQSTEEKYRHVVENAIEAIVVLQDGLVKFVNPASLKLFGYSEEEIISIPFTEFIYPEDRELIYKNYLKRLKGEAMPSVYPLRALAKDGTVKWVEIHAVSIAWGEKPATLYFLGDITEHKRFEEERQQSIDRLRRALGATVQAISAIVESRDPYTAGHQKRVADLARSMATEMGLTNHQIDGIRMAGIIHDLGKISVPAEILSKPTKLTDIEFGLIKVHPQSGYDILKDIDFSWPIARIVLEHHERMNGSGYPYGLSGDNLLIESRIIAVADIVEAIASHRPYRPALGLDAALDEIEKNRGILYDSEAVDACLKLFREDRYSLEG